MKNAIKLLAATLLVGLLSACSTATAQPATTTPSASATNPYGGFPVDPPADNEVVLTVTGTKTIDYTLPQLKALTQVEATIDEPFVNKQQSFTGVELNTLFEASGISATDKVSTVALNDYKYEDVASKFTASKGILALTRDSEIIPMDQGGPIRIVFPADQDYSKYLDAWNWSLRTIEVIK